MLDQRLRHWANIKPALTLTDVHEDQSVDIILIPKMTLRAGSMGSTLETLTDSYDPRSQFTIPPPPREYVSALDPELLRAGREHTRGGGVLIVWYFQSKT